MTPPWNKPYSEWTYKELHEGLRACIEYNWKNNERHIRSEFVIRRFDEDGMR